MNLKRLSIPLVLALLAIAFLFVCFMVWARNGNSPKWIARKMKLGGIMLSLTAILYACDPGNTAALDDKNPPFTCYLVAPEALTENLFYLEDVSDSTITLELARTPKVNGEIKNRTLDIYSFAILDTANNKVQIGNINASDGNYDEDIEDFSINIDNDLDKGNYTMRFYLSDKDEQPDWTNQYIKLKLK